MPTHRTLSTLLDVPVLVQAAFADAVTALLNHGVVEDVTADGAGEVFLGESRASAFDGRHRFTRTGLSSSYVYPVFSSRCPLCLDLSKQNFRTYFRFQYEWFVFAIWQ